MTEENIFKILLGHFEKDSYQLDHPTLQPEVVNVFSKHLTDIIYESFKTKSSSSNSKRNNILKLLNNMSQVKGTHLNVAVEEPLKIIENNFEANPVHFEDFKTEFNSSSTLENIVTFYNNRNLKLKEKLTKLEYIRKYDQQIIDDKYNITLKKTFTHCDINENVVKNVLRNFDKHNISNNNKINHGNAQEYRAQQIKLGYALLVINSSNSKMVLEKILVRLSKYKVLEDFEEKFLYYFCLNIDGYGKFMDLFVRNFFFILERIIIEKSKQILFLNKNEVHDYFVNLGENKDMIMIKSVCKQHNDIFVKIRSLLYELYCLCFCNKNVLQLCTFIL